MKLFAPKYYGFFKCIADRCRNSCCIGWEIDIDEDTLCYYDNVKGKFGEKLINNISRDGQPRFILSQGDRCPFLNECHLCDIYTELGEEHLCGICRDHPRFRNFFDSRTEIGLGMCCEAASRLILNYSEPFSLTEIEDDGKEDAVSSVEREFFSLRNKVFSIICDRTESIDSRIERLKSEFGIIIPEKTFDEWIGVYLSLEVLNPEWTELLKASYEKKLALPAKYDEKTEIAFEQLLAYFVFRHLQTDEISSYLGFCLVSFFTVRNLFFAGEGSSAEKLCDIARMYSAEIEYCTENTEELLFIIETE